MAPYASRLDSKVCHWKLLDCKGKARLNSRYSGWMLVSARVGGKYREAVTACMGVFGHSIVSVSATNSPSRKQVSLVGSWEAVSVFTWTPECLMITV
jgi:hypothetical protein